MARFVVRVHAETKMGLGLLIVRVHAGAKIEIWLDLWLGCMLRQRWG